MIEDDFFGFIYLYKDMQNNNIKQKFVCVLRPFSFVEGYNLLLLAVEKDSARVETSITFYTTGPFGCSLQHLLFLFCYVIQSMDGRWI